MRTLQEFVRQVQATAATVGGDIARASAAAAKQLGIDLSKASIVHEVEQVASVVEAVAPAATAVVASVAPAAAPVVAAVSSVAAAVDSLAHQAQAAQAAPASTAPVDVALADVGQILGVTDQGKLVALGEALLRLVGHGFVASQSKPA